MSADQACYHCGLPIPPDSDFTLEIKGETRGFCCPGCRAVAGTIVGAGLEAFYDYRTAQATTQEERQQALYAEYRLYDRRELQREFVYYNEDNQPEARLVIEGITCAACSWLIEHHLQSMPGVVSCHVNVSNHRANLIWDPNVTQLSDLLIAIDNIGYQPHPLQATQQEALAQKTQKQFVRRLGIAGIGMAQVMMYAVALYAGAFEGIDDQQRDWLRLFSLLIATPVVFYSAQPFFLSAWRGLVNKHLGMDLPISIAIGVAYTASLFSTFAGGEHIYFDSVCMFTFFLLLGRFFEYRAREKLSQGAAVLSRALPPSVIRLENGQQTQVALIDLEPGDQVLIKAGHIIPCDGVVLEGNTSVDESSLTGEFAPVAKQAGDSMLAGCLNVEQPVVITVSATGQQTRLSAILHLMDQALSQKPPIAQLADRIASYFVATILLATTLVGFYWYQAAPDQAFWIMLSVLVVSCPCALSLATPVALTAATSALQKQGLLVIQGHTSETLAKCDTLVFDKTGTLTQGRLTLQSILPLGSEARHACYEIARALEAQSEHPIARAFADTQELQTNSSPSASNIQVVPGQGIEGQIGSRHFRLGQPEFACEWLIDKSVPPLPEEDKDPSIWILLSDTQQALAWFKLTDALKPHAAETIKALISDGFDIHLLSGDRQANADAIGAKLGIPHRVGAATPADKMAYVTQLQEAGKTVAMFGDGLNDIPVLATADVSVAMASATDLTKANADSLFIAENLLQIPACLQRAKQAQQVIRQNISWAIGYNLLALPLAAAGFVPPYLAAIGMSCSSLLVVLNALRLAKSPKVDVANPTEASTMLAQAAR